MVRDRAIDEAASKLIDSEGDNATLGTSSTLSPHTYGLKVVSNSPKIFLKDTPKIAAASLINSHIEHKLLYKPRGAGSGAAMDGGNEWLNSKNMSNDCQQRPIAREKPSQNMFVSSTKKSHGAIHNTDEEKKTQETILEGLHIPKDIQGMTSLNYILTQQPGKLKPKALQEAIRSQRAIRAEKHKEQEELRAATTGGCNGGVEFSAIIMVEKLALMQKQKMSEGSPSKQSRQMRELAFLQDLAEHERAENEREFKSSHEAIGLQLLSPAQLDTIVSQRNAV